MASSTPELIKTAVEGLQAEVPALAKLKLVFGLELKGRGDVQLYRVEVPGPKISKGMGDDERVHVSIPRAAFNELAAVGKLTALARCLGSRRTSRSRATRTSRSSSAR